MFWQFYHHNEICDRFITTQPVTSELELKWVFLFMIFKYTISAPCLCNKIVNKFTRWLAHSSLLFPCGYSTERKWSPLHTSKLRLLGEHWKSHISCSYMVSQAWRAVTNPRLHAPTLGLDIGIVAAIPAWWRCQYEANFSEKISNNTNSSSILLKVTIGVHFRSSCHVGGSSD